MIGRLGLVAVALGIVLRLVAVASHEAPRGDVVIDVGVARSLAAGDGFSSGYERAVARVAGDRPVPRQDLADQHPPLWPLVGALLSVVTGSVFAGLKLGSLLAGIGVLLLTWRITDRLLEGIVGAPDGLAPLAAGLVALSFVAIDASGNGSLYAAQSLLVLVLVERLAAPRPSVVRTGVVLGLLLLLNHQSAVLLVVPPVVLALGAGPGQRLRAGLAGVVAVGVALLCQAPWWVRNALAFDDSFHSVNGIYLLHRAGVPMTFGLEDGIPVFRFARELTASVALSGMPGWLRPNGLYLLTTGLLVWPGLLGVVCAGVLPRFADACRARDRRAVAILVTSAALAAVALAWPATKLRYLVVLVPLVTVLGVALLARRPGRLERGLGLLVVLGWLGTLLLTRGDVTGALADARPERWWRLALAGGGLLVLPLALHAVTRLASPWRWGVASGLVVAPLLSALPLLEPPRTAYHGTAFVPDFFGQDAEVEEAARAAALARARASAERAGARRVAGPVGLLAWETPALVELPTGAGHDVLRTSLGALLARDAVDHVVLLAADARDLASGGTGGTGGTGDALAVGQPLVGGRLRIVAGDADWVLAEVVGP